MALSERTSWERTCCISSGTHASMYLSLSFSCISLQHLFSRRSLLPKERGFYQDSCLHHAANLFLQLLYFLYFFLFCSFTFQNVCGRGNDGEEGVFFQPFRYVTRLRSQSANLSTGVSPHHSSVCIICRPTTCVVRRDAYLALQDKG